MAIIALYHIKGGVGKTAGVVNLSYLAAQESAKTLLIDLDPQGAASFYFRVRASKKLKSKSFLKKGKTIAENIKSTDYENLDILPATLSYRKLDLRLNSLKKSRTRLRAILKQVGQEYQFIFIDSPPNITLVSENIFDAADILLIPVIPTTLSILTYKQLLQFFKDQELDQSKIVGFFSMVEKRKKMHREIMTEILEQNKANFLKHYILYSADVENMGIHREPVIYSKPNSIASKSYQEIWSELKKLMYYDLAEP